MNQYQQFLQQKKHSIGDFGFKANYIPDIAFDFQKHIIEKAVAKGLSLTHIKHSRLLHQYNTPVYHQH